MKRASKFRLSALFTGLAATVFFLNAELATEARAQKGQDIEYSYEGQRDPFQQEEIEIVEPEVQAEPQPLPALEVQGMVWGGTLPQAIINNKVVKIGDVIEGVRIAAIDKSGITIFFENRPHILTVPVKKSADELNNDQNT